MLLQFFPINSSRGLNFNIDLANRTCQFNIRIESCFNINCTNCFLFLILLLLAKLFPNHWLDLLFGNEKNLQFDKLFDGATKFILVKFVN